jgi:uncharacterized membrane protein YoaK (UPF0700 family)
LSPESTPATEGAARVERGAASFRQPLIRVLLVLTFTTGLIDAVSFLGLGHVFTANMTGNVVLLGFGLAGAGQLPVVAPLISLGAFLLGAGAGGVLAARLAHRHPDHLAAALAIEATLIGVAAILTAVIDIHIDAASGDVVIAVLGSAMGVRNTTTRRLAVPDMTTTVLTGTLTSLASGLPLFGGSGEGTARRAAAALAMLTGAVVGALLLKTSVALPLAAATALALITWWAYVPPARHSGAGGRRGKSPIAHQQ